MPPLTPQQPRQAERSGRMTVTQSRHGRPAPVRPPRRHVCLIGRRHRELLGDQHVARLAADQVLRQHELLVVQSRVRCRHAELLCRQHVRRRPGLQAEDRIGRRYAELLSGQHVGGGRRAQAEPGVRRRHPELLSRQYVAHRLVGRLVAHLSTESSQTRRRIKASALPCDNLSRIGLRSLQSPRTAWYDPLTFS